MLKPIKQDTAKDQLAASIEKSLKRISSLDKELKDFEHREALDLYEHLVVDVMEGDYSASVFDRLLSTLLIAHDAMTKGLTLEEVNPNGPSAAAARMGRSK